MSILPISAPYTLVICEKPNAAERIAEALKEKELKLLRYGKVKVFVVINKDKIYVICSAIGHLYTVSDPLQKRYVYPVFDVEWFPLHKVNKTRLDISQRIDIIKKLAKNANNYINACDFDQEGETIGFNILKYACGEKQNLAFRTKFSTLTKEELQKAFGTAEKGLGNGLAKAGRTRHIIDFIFGVNLSRALSESYYLSNTGYKNITIGRVQGPTISFIVNREVDIRTFVPTPFWKLYAKIAKDGSILSLDYETKQIKQQYDVQNIKNKCKKKNGLVTKIIKSLYHQMPPIPFNIGDLQKDAYTLFGYSPSQTIRISEKLYLDALISYPRTSSQKLPTSIDFKKILNGLQRNKSYSQNCNEILMSKMVPNEGSINDSAHPAIFPTGNYPKHKLSYNEFRLYDLIVHRFFAVFGEDAHRKRIIVTVDIAGYLFNISGKQTLKEGWLKYYKKYIHIDDKSIPDFVEGEQLTLLSMISEEKFDQPTSRYNQRSLLKKMEEENIGTKSTRADIIKMLYTRRYISSNNIIATNIAFSVVETMEQYNPQIISTDMSRQIEKNLEKIERLDLDESIVIQNAVDQIYECLTIIKKDEKVIGTNIGQAFSTTILEQNLLCSCPICKTGNLNIIRSSKTGKRFVGCSGYNKNCRASSPLPKKGKIIVTGKICNTCRWPIINMIFKNKPWKFCVNIKCASKKVKKDEM